MNYQILKFDEYEYAKFIKISILFTIFMFFIYLNINVNQRDFSDTDTYLFYIDSIYFFREKDWWTFETFSKFLMIYLRKISLDTEHSVYLYRFVLIFIFPFFIFYIYRNSSWQALLVSLALYGPLLGLITMRATPAYVLATLAVVAAMEGKARALAYLAGGFLFHVSTALAVPAALMIFVLKKYGVSKVKNNYLFIIFIIFAIFYLFAIITGTDFILNFIKSFNSLTKYVAYIPLAESTSEIIEEAPKLEHYIFSTALVFMSIFLIFKSRENQGIEKIFLSFSLLVYLILFSLYSPVVSLRFSPFFILPALARIDISLSGRLRGISSAAIIVGSLIVFSLSLDQVLYQL